MHTHKTQAEVDACGSDVRECGGVDYHELTLRPLYGVYCGQWFAFESGHWTYGEFRRATLTEDPVEADRMLGFAKRDHRHARILKVLVRCERVSEKLEEEILQKKLERALAKLDAEDRRVLNLFYERR